MNIFDRLNIPKILFLGCFGLATYLKIKGNDVDAMWVLGLAIINAIIAYRKG